MPQFDFAHNYWLGQIFWMIILFVLLYVIFVFIVLPKIRRTINAREQKISMFVNQSEEAQKKVQNLSKQKQTLIQDNDNMLRQLKKNTYDKIALETEEMHQNILLKEKSLEEEHIQNVQNVNQQLQSMQSDIKASVYKAYVHKMENISKSSKV